MSPVLVEAGSEDWVIGAESTGVNLRPAAKSDFEVLGADTQVELGCPV